MTIAYQPRSSVVTRDDGERMLRVDVTASERDIIDKALERSLKNAQAAKGTLSAIPSPTHELDLTIIEIERARALFATQISIPEPTPIERVAASSAPKVKDAGQMTLAEGAAAADMPITPITWGKKVPQPRPAPDTPVIYPAKRPTRLVAHPIGFDRDRAAFEVQLRPLSPNGAVEIVYIYYAPEKQQWRDLAELLRYDDDIEDRNAPDSAPSGTADDALEDPPTLAESASQDQGELPPGEGFPGVPAAPIAAPDERTSAPEIAPDVPSEPAVVGDSAPENGDALTEQPPEGVGEGEEPEQPAGETFANAEPPRPRRGRIVHRRASQDDPGKPKGARPAPRPSAKQPEKPKPATKPSDKGKGKPKR